MVLIQFDQVVTSFILGIFSHSPFFNTAFSFFSLNGGSLLIWVLVIIIVLTIEEIYNPGIQKRDKLFILYFLIAFTTAFVVSDYVLKPLFQRERPFVAYHNVNSTCPADYSFPSTHAATAFAAAVILSAFDKKRKGFYYLVAVLISFSRIYLGCHYFLDVAVGAIIGYFIGKTILFLSKKKIWT